MAGGFWRWARRGMMRICEKTYAHDSMFIKRIYGLRYRIFSTFAQDWHIQTLCRIKYAPALIDASGCSSVES